MDKKITVEKVGSDVIPTTTITKTVGGIKHKLPPKGILKKTSKIKLKGVRDPSSSKKHTIRLLTNKGHKRHAKTMKRKISNLSDKKVTEITKNAGLVKNSDVPSHLKRQILDHAISAGFVSL